jgi:phage gp36-like protein
MAYADRDKIQSRSTKHLTESTMPSDKLANAQEFADAEIDFRLSERYLVPFSDPAPDKIIEISADLAAYFAILDIFQNGTADAPVEYAQELYRRAQESLALLAGGNKVATLPDPDSEATAIPSGIRVRAGRLPLLANFDGVNRPSYGRWPE